MVSLLIAVYNAEDYLHRCLDSLLAQTYSDWQAICIDDCSTDSSLSILKEYEQMDGRITVMHLNENRGHAHARNQGLLFAKGEYIGFLDSDDWLSNDALEQMVATFKEHPQTDAVLFNVVYKYPDGREHGYASGQFDVMSGFQAFKASLTWQIHGVYAIRANIHLKYPYDESYRSYSDDNITTRLHYFVSREVRCCSGIYYYWQNNKSVTHISDTSRLNLLRATATLHNLLEQLDLGEDRNEIMEIHELHRWKILIDTYYFYHRNRCHFNRSQRKECLFEIHKHWNIIKSTIHKFGYAHCNHWWLFRIQEEIYFLLKSFINP